MLCAGRKNFTTLYLHTEQTMNVSHAAFRCFLTLAIAVLFASGPAFAQTMPVGRIKEGPGVTQTRMLSHYHPGLANTPGDTPVYVMDSGKPGGTVFIAGGTHGNEPSGYVTAILLVENAVPKAGRLIIIPHANASAIAHPDARADAPRSFTLKTPGGDRTFPYGSRLSNPAHQGRDPENYTHPRAEKPAEGSTARNLNRLHPGKAGGNLTEQLAHGLAELIRKEKADMAIDLHEANPESPIRDVLIAHDRAMDVAAEAVMNLEMEGMHIRLDASPSRMWGLSHREWGDHTDTMAILMETINPAQGRRANEATEDIIVFGRDGKNPLAERVARHVTAVSALLQVYSEQHPQRPVTVEGVPEFAAIRDNLGNYLAP